jgi:hypothetical protein
VIRVVEEAEMKSAGLKAFLFGIIFGIGMTMVCLYAQKPGRLATSIETIAEMGRARGVRKEERNLLGDRLKATGFSDKEIDEYFAEKDLSE